LPPGGGEEDKEPPKIIESYPTSGTVNFRGDRITIRFSEYVDRRSFQDAFRISPPVSGDITFDWSGKEVNVIFPEPLRRAYPEKTFLVNLNSNLKDLHGNSITEPLTLAFSTGNKIDKAGISGKVYNNGQKIITILAYNISAGENSYDPVTKLGDYITETSAEGVYTLQNLAPGKFRIIAINDDDRNLFYTAGRESFSVLPYDVVLTDSTLLRNIDFNLYNISEKTTDTTTVNFFGDSLDIVYSSVENNSRYVLPEQSISFYFKNYLASRTELESSFQLKDAQNSSIKTVFNWRNDSLLEIFPASNFQPGMDYTLTFSLPFRDGNIYKYKLSFRTASTNSFGDIIGSVVLPERNSELVSVVIQLESRETKPPATYTFQVQDTSFHLRKILENDYSLLAFMDKNGNRVYDFGNPYPFDYSERFFYYPKTIKVKAGWSVENVIINFNQ
jgi:Big-like domain-containing protein